MNTPSIETNNVHTVYEAIADHFSRTRYKAWPIVARFMNGLPDYSLVLDSGCGNGKNMAVNTNIHVIGCDMSTGLVTIAAKRGLNVFIGDTICLPHADNHFDAAVSVAVIHHLSTHERRLHSVQELLRVVKPGGMLLISVWAFENNARIEKICGKNLNGPDVMVPWKQETGELSRFYHLFMQHELDDLIITAGGTILESENDHDNWFVIFTKPT